MLTFVGIWWMLIVLIFVVMTSCLYQDKIICECEYYQDEQNVLIWLILQFLEYYINTTTKSFNRFPTTRCTMHSNKLCKNTSKITNNIRIIINRVYVCWNYYFLFFKWLSALIIMLCKRINRIPLKSICFGRIY